MAITPEQLKEAMVATGIERVDHHTCDICGQWKTYVRQGDSLFFDGSCECGTIPLMERSWEQAADWVNLNVGAYQKKILAAFGLHL